jgi:hypothetical protein
MYEANNPNSLQNRLLPVLLPHAARLAGLKVQFCPPRFFAFIADNNTTLLKFQ